MEANNRYSARGNIPPVQHGYMTHDSHMRVFAAMMSGREEDAMRSAREMWTDLVGEVLEEVGSDVDVTMCAVFDVQKRFGRWDAILVEPAPPSFLVVTTATWHAARAVAYAAKRDFPKAEREYAAFRDARDAVPTDKRYFGDPARRVLEVAEHFIAGEIVLQKRDWAEAAKRLEQAAAVEDTLAYGEPPAWLQPVRHTLGAVYLNAGRHADAERVYREDLAKWPRNGWSLLGLSRTLAKQGKNAEAEKVEAEYKEVWKLAEELTDTSCKCLAIP